MNSPSSLPSPLEQPALLAQFGERLVTLCDGRTGVRGSFPAEIRAPSARGGAGPPAPVLDFIASSDTLDRCGEVIVPSGWRLENYRSNPVFQNAHQYGDIIFTLGKALITEVRPGNPTAPELALPTPHLFQKAQLATDI